MKNAIKKAMFGALFALVAIAANSLKAQTTDTATYIIETNDGGQIVGVILSEDERELRIKTNDHGTIIVPKYAIKSRTLVTEQNRIGKKVVSKNPHPSRYFYAPSAIPLEKGEAYLQTVYFTTAQANYGFTKNFSAGIGLTAIGSPVMLHAKYGGKLGENVHVAIGAQAANFTYLAPDLWAGVGFGSITFGNMEKNITFSGGLGALRLKVHDYVMTETYNTGTNTWEYSYSVTERIEYETTPMASVAGSLRLSNRASFFGEFWYIDAVQGVFGGPGLRVYPGRRTSWDFMLCTVMVPDVPVFVVPGLSATWKLSN